MDSTGWQAMTIWRRLRRGWIACGRCRWSSLTWKPVLLPLTSEPIAAGSSEPTSGVSIGPPPVTASPSLPVSVALEVVFRRFGGEKNQVVIEDFDLDREQSVIIDKVSIVIVLVERIDGFLMEAVLPVV